MGIKFGVITDVHYNDGTVQALWPAGGSPSFDAQYRQFSTADARYSAANATFESEAVDFAIQVGDLEDAQSEDYYGDLNTAITTGDAQFTVGNLWNVLGNHENSLFDATKGGELITNGTMEVDGNWADRLLEGGDTNLQSTTQVYSGVYSREIVVDAASEGMTGDVYATVTNKEYLLTYWAYPDDTTDSRHLIRLGDDSNFITGTVINMTGLNQDAWNKVTYLYKETAGGASAYVALLGTGAGTWYFDDVSVKANLLTNGMMTAWDDASTPTGWTSSATTGNSEVSEVDPDEGHGGAGVTGGAVNIWTDNTSNTWIGQASILTVGKSYRITVDAMVTSGTVKFYDGTSAVYGTVTGTGTAQAIDFVATGTGLYIQRDTTDVDITLDNISIVERSNTFDDFWTEMDTASNAGVRENVWNPDGKGALAYTFDYKSMRFVVLFAAAAGIVNMESPDGVGIGTWLADIALDTPKACVVFSHGLLTDSNFDYSTQDNVATIRGILEAAGNVQLMIQGHFHRNGIEGYGTPVKSYQRINDILYYYCRGSVLGAEDGNSGDTATTADSAYYIFDVQPSSIIGDNQFRANVTVTAYEKGKAKSQDTFRI